MNEPLFYLAGILGALIGSFLNVLIYRLPIKKDIVFDRSACPSCGGQIPFYLNIPLIGFIFLRGKCQKCKQPIRWRYPLVELITAVIFVFALPEHIDVISFYSYFLHVGVSCALIVHFFIDLEHRLLLDKINVYLLLLILPYSIIFNLPMFWLVGGAIGFLGPLLVSWLFFKIKGKMGLGGGDIKLWGVLGLLLGPVGIMENIFFSSFLGSIIGIILIIQKRYHSDAGIPFGPFIILVALSQMYFPNFFRGLALFGV